MRIFSGNVVLAFIIQNMKTFRLNGIVVIFISCELQMWSINFFLTAQYMRQIRLLLCKQQTAVQYKNRLIPIKLGYLRIYLETVFKFFIIDI